MFVLATHDDPKQRHYLNLYKLGEGPLYSFYTPYHLCHFEVPQTVARAVLFGDATIAPLGAPTVEVVTTAKRDLTAGKVLDGLGGYDTYGEAERADVTAADDLLPMGVAEGCTLRRDVAKDERAHLRRRRAAGRSPRRPAAGGPGGRAARSPAGAGLRLREARSTRQRGRSAMKSGVFKRLVEFAEGGRSEGGNHSLSVEDREALVTEYFQSYVESGMRRWRYALRHPVSSGRAFNHLMRLPRLTAELSDSVGGRAISAGLERERPLVRTPVHSAVTVLALPDTPEEYSFGRPMQTLRRKCREAEKRGVRWAAVTEVAERERLADLADDRDVTHPRDEYRTTGRANRALLVHPLMLAAYADGIGVERALGGALAGGECGFALAFDLPCRRDRSA